MVQTMIRRARPDDCASIRAVLEAAFNQADEADLVDRLRAAADVIVELVAEEDDAVVGHILFSTLSIDGPGGELRAAALAPLAVAPPRQATGVGGMLIRAGIEECLRLGLAAIVVLGHRDYNPRFGFSAKDAESLKAPFRGPSFMALELTPGALGPGGRVRYAAAFGV